MNTPTKLVPKLITDKNGKFTTVMVNPFVESHSSRTADISLKYQDKALPKPRLNTPNEKGFINHETVFYGGVSWSLAPENHSGAYCRTCRAFYRKEQMGYLNDAATCDNCGERGTIYDYGIGIEYDSQRFLNEEEVKKEIWYHSTVKEGWYEQVTRDPSRPLVHLGTLESAAVRAEYTSRYFSEGKKPIYNYAMRLKPEATLSLYVLKDENDDAPRHENEGYDERYDTQGITRYVNAFEDPGAISLLSSIQSFEVIDMTQWN